MYNLELYPAENIWWWWKLLLIFADEKKVLSQQGAMPGHALFLAMDNFFRWIVNFSEQCLVRKVAVANFATIAERQIALPWRLRPYAAYISHSPRVGRLSMIRRHKVEQLTHNPNGVCLKFAAGCAKHCERIGVRVLPEPYTDIGAYVQAWHLWTLSAHTYITHGSPRTQPPEGELCRFGILENFCYLYVTIDGIAYRTRHVQTLQAGLERCSLMDAMPDIQAMTRRKRYPYQKTGLRIRKHYEKPAVRCGTNRNGSIR